MQPRSNAEQRQQYRETELGFLPESWEVVTINDLFNIQQGKQLSARESKEKKLKNLFCELLTYFGRESMSQLFLRCFLPKKNSKN